MGMTDWDIRIITDYLPDGVLYGFLLQIHRGDQNVLTTSPQASNGMAGALIGCAKHGTNADLNAIGVLVFPGWWNNEVVSRGITDTTRQALKASAEHRW